MWKKIAWEQIPGFCSLGGPYFPPPTPVTSLDWSYLYWRLVFSFLSSTHTFWARMNRPMTNQRNRAAKQRNNNVLPPDILFNCPFPGTPGQIVRTNDGCTNSNMLPFVQVRTCRKENCCRYMIVPLRQISEGNKNMDGVLFRKDATVPQNMKNWCSPIWQNLQ